MRVRPHSRRQRAERKTQIEPQTIGSINLSWRIEMGLSGAWKSPRTENRGMTFAMLSVFMSKKTKLCEFLDITIGISYSITICSPKKMWLVGLKILPAPGGPVTKPQRCWKAGISANWSPWLLPWSCRYCQGCTNACSRNKHSCFVLGGQAARSCLVWEIMSDQGSLGSPGGCDRKRLMDFGRQDLRRALAPPQSWHKDQAVVRAEQSAVFARKVRALVRVYPQLLILMKLPYLLN